MRKRILTIKFTLSRRGLPVIVVVAVVFAVVLVASHRRRRRHWIAPILEFVVVHHPPPLPLPVSYEVCKLFNLCENILRGYLYGGDLLFVILKGIYGFKFPERFLEISSRDLTSFPLLSILII